MANKKKSINLACKATIKIGTQTYKCCWADPNHAYEHQTWHDFNSEQNEVHVNSEGKTYSIRWFDPPTEFPIDLTKYNKRQLRELEDKIRAANEYKSKC